MFSGDTITFTTGQEMRPFTIILAGGELERLRETLRAVRPSGHSPHCDHHDGPDTWIDESDDPPFVGRAVEWVRGEGFVDRGPVEVAPYVGWCCSEATRRHVIDETLTPKRQDEHESE